MGRIVIIACLVTVLFTHCQWVEQNDLEPIIDENTLSADFEIQILNEAEGRVQFIDQSTGAEYVEWKVLFENDKVYTFPNGILPGDTILMKFNDPGKYIIMAVASKAVWDGQPVLNSVSKIDSIFLNISTTEIGDYSPFLQYITLSSYPLVDKYGLAWDHNNGLPDVEAILGYVNPETYIPLTNGPLIDLALEDLPISWVLNDEIFLFPRDESESKGRYVDIILADNDLPEGSLEEMYYVYLQLDSTDSPLQPGIVEYVYDHINFGVEWR